MYFPNLKFFAGISRSILLVQAFIELQLTEYKFERKFMYMRKITYGKSPEREIRKMCEYVNT